MKAAVTDNGIQNDFLRELTEAAEYGRKKLQIAKENRPFCIVVCGVFSSGKSSLINALLGTELPTGINPVTKVVTRIRYGRAKRIVLKDIQNNTEWEISEEVAESIILNQSKDERHRDLQIYIETPSTFLANNIEIIDTPGLDDDKRERLDELTKQEIRNADFCIINYMCTKFAEKSEREFLEEIQALTNGNFVSVLNCLNYLQQGEQQLIDLEKRAKFVLGEYGNDRIGKGRYFRVDSQNKDDAYLDGLDTWLAEIIRKYGHIMQADTPLTMAYVELRRIKKKCDDYIIELYEEIDQLRTQNNVQIKQQKKQAQLDKNKMLSRIASDKIKAKDQLTAALREKLREGLRQVDRETSYAQYAAKAKQHIQGVAIGQATQIWQNTRWNKAYAGIDCKYDLNWRFEQCLRTFVVPEPKYSTRERGLLDVDRYLTGRYYRVYNDYVQATLDEVRSTLLPILKLRIDEYFDAIEKNFENNNGKDFSGGLGAQIRKMEDYINRLSDASLNAMDVLHQVRSLRDKLIQERI